MRKFIYAALLLAGASQAQDFRALPLPSLRERPSYVQGANGQRWTSGQVDWYYNPINQPLNLSTSAVLNAIQNAAARWSGMCNITFVYRGMTSTLPNMYGDASTVEGANVFGWGVLQGDDASYSGLTKSWFVGDSYVDSDIMMNTMEPWAIDEVEAIMTHELGHAIGLMHSDRFASVMFADPYHSARYMRTLRGDDADGCASLYGAAATARSNRTLNWAEAAYPQYLSPSPSASGTFSGYYYRYYSGTNSYVGIRDGVAYFMGPDGVIQTLGTLNTYYFNALLSGY